MWVYLVAKEFSDYLKKEMCEAAFLFPFSFISVKGMKYYDCPLSIPKIGQKVWLKKALLNIETYKKVFIPAVKCSETFYTISN